MGGSGETERPRDSGLLEGAATPEGTARFASRFPHLPGHFRRPDRLTLSSLALGTRRGDPGGVDDLLYRSAVAQCLEGGINVFDTALSDRMQTSERALGSALARAFRDGDARRDEVVVVSKGGVLVCEPEDATSYAQAQRALRRTYVDSGLVDPRNVVNGHAIDPPFLLDQIQRSRRNLGLATIDLYLVQEPELHLRALGPNGFRERFSEVMRSLEEAVARGWIGAYGVSTWDGLLVPHSERGHLSIVELFEMALEVGGGHHHMWALQLPYGLAAGEGAVLESQLGPDGRTASALATLGHTGTVVLASAPLYGGRVLGRVPGFVRRALPGARSDAQRCLQFVRSTAHITSAVVGMREPDHVDDNLALARIPPEPPSVPAELFRQAEDGGRAA
ncbi:MAG: aldo/keto reductase [Myxococcota bacterium]